jgi:hypothetical protein
MATGDTAKAGQTQKSTGVKRVSPPPSERQTDESDDTESPDLSFSLRRQAVALAQGLGRVNRRCRRRRVRRDRSCPGVATRPLAARLLLWCLQHPAHVASTGRIDCIESAVERSQAACALSAQSRCGFAERPDTRAAPNAGLDGWLAGRRAAGLGRFSRPRKAPVSERRERRPAGAVKAPDGCYA